MTLSATMYSQGLPIPDLEWPAERLNEILKGGDLQIVNRKTDELFCGEVSNMALAEDGTLTVSFADFGRGICSGTHYNEGRRQRNIPEEVMPVLNFYVQAEPKDFSVRLTSGQYDMVQVNGDEFCIHVGEFTLTFHPRRNRIDRRYFRSEQWIARVSDKFKGHTPIYWDLDDRSHPDLSDFES